MYGKELYNFSHSFLIPLAILPFLLGVCVSWIMWNIREIMIFASFAASFINAAKLMMILAYYKTKIRQTNNMFKQNLYPCQKEYALFVLLASVLLSGSLIFISIYIDKSN